MTWCWCCGTYGPDERMVHLGNRPEVAVCIRCAYSLQKWAGEIEDRDRHTLAARARDRLRDVRRYVVRKGWHQHPVVGRGLRRLGRYVP
ncbi:MAG: hypothetical protein ACRDVG_04295 [Jatrophihabitantaceae bacterium]